MKYPLREFARIGIVHHLLHSAALCNPEDHAQTLMQLAQRGDIDTFDCCLPYDQGQRENLISVIRTCGKEQIAYAAHQFPFYDLPPTSLAPHEQAQCRLIMKDMVESAVAIRATHFLFASGRPPAQDAREAHYTAFESFCRWLCGELKRYNITALIEPFNFSIDKKFLYGPTEQCVKLIEALHPDVNNLAIELDFAHVPLMGESFSHAVTTVAPYLKRVHLGNCIFKDPEHALYGDQHPPIGIKGGEIGVPQLAEILRLLLAIKFLDRNNRGALLIEVVTLPEHTAEDTIRDSLICLHKAWTMA